MTPGSHRPRILKPDETYTFPRYFDLQFAPADILHELGASLAKAAINFPVNTNQITRLADLKARLEEAIARVSLTSEAARREVLIAPILLEVAHITESTINIEYPIEVSRRQKLKVRSKRFSAEALTTKELMRFTFLYIVMFIRADLLIKIQYVSSGSKTGRPNTGIYAASSGINCLRCMDRIG